MKLFFKIILLFFIVNNSIAQGLNETIYTQTMSKVVGKKTEERMVEIAKCFITQPYKAGTLEGKEEKLIVNLSEFDCATLVEQSLAMAQSNSYKDFQQKLRKLRYKNGKIDGYGSRIHYLTEWLIEHEIDGTFVNLTKSIGGEKFTKKVQFMTQNPKYFPSANTDKIKQQIQKSEDRINQEILYFIPKNKFKNVQSKIKNGDIIAITSAKNDLDCAHQGIAIWVKDKLHLLHASLTKKEVIISEETLDNYLNKNILQNGIMIVRLK